jgi:hypothetical protein
MLAETAVMTGPPGATFCITGFCQTFGNNIRKKPKCSDAMVAL